MSRLLTLVAAGALALIAGVAVADDLDRVISRDKIAAGKLLSDASAALKDSISLEKTAPARAAALLEKSIAELRDARVLGEEAQREWINKLSARLRSVNETAHAMKLAVEDKARREAEELFRKMREEEIKKGSRAFGTAKSYIGSVAEQVAAADRLRKERAAGAGSIFREIDSTPLTIAGYVEYPKYWDKIIDRRPPGGMAKLHPKEVALLKTLNSTMNADFDERPLKEVLDFIQEKTGLSIVVSKLSLEEAGIDYEDRVTFKVPRVTVRTILKKILADRGLTYVIKEGALQVVTPMRAREMMVVRSYPVQDLLGGDPRFGPFVDRAIMLNNANSLINTIKNAIEPGIWDTNGGSATITLYEPTMSLIVRAPAELHYMLGGGSLFR
jgi:hypothetical protein